MSFIGMQKYVSNVIKLIEIKKLFNYLWNLKEQDKFWDNSLGGYNKQVCFRDYMYPQNDKDYFKWYYQNIKFIKGRQRSNENDNRKATM